MADDLLARCRALRLGRIEDLLEQVEYRDKRQFLSDVLGLVLERRRALRGERLVRQAGFPLLKTLEGYSFEPITFPHGMDAESLMELGFIEERSNLLLVGAVGTGKTHLAIALGIKACLTGRAVRFFRAADLTNQLAERHRQGTACRFVDAIAKADLLILDELGYVPFSRHGSELLFTVIANSYERQSIIVTSNLEFGRWSEVFANDRLAAAMIDRLVHHSHILAFSGDSLRLREALGQRDKSATRKSPTQY